MNPLRSEVDAANVLNASAAYNLRREGREGFLEG
jgi:hypothetical protein